MKNNNNQFRVIFLDVDGVLNDRVTSETCEGYVGIDDYKVEYLKQIIDATNAKIVLSSSWRVNRTNKDQVSYKLRGYLDEKLVKYGLEIYSETPQHKSGTRYHRGYEIKAWRDKHKNITSWIVIDDEVFQDFEEYGVLNHLVHTHEWLGLTDANVEQAIWMLENNLPYSHKKQEDL